MVQVQLTRRYYKATTVDIDIPEGTEDVMDYIDNLPNADELWANVDDADLEFEDSEIEILED